MSDRSAPLASRRGGGAVPRREQVLPIAPSGGRTVFSFDSAYGAREPTACGSPIRLTRA